MGEVISRGHFSLSQSSREKQSTSRKKIGEGHVWKEMKFQILRPRGRGGIEFHYKPLHLSVNTSLSLLKNGNKEREFLLSFSHMKVKQ